MDGIRRYYIGEASQPLADRFYEAFLGQVNRALENPERFHPVDEFLRRAPVTGFPYHFLYRRIRDGIRVLVLRHDRRHPAFGLSRE